MIRRIAAIMLVLGSACGRETPRSSETGTASGVVQWSADEPLTRDPGGAAPHFAQSRDGRLALAWVAAPGNGVEGRLVVRPDASAPGTVELRDPSGNLTVYGETPPKIAYAPDGTLYAAYLVTKAVAGHKWPVNALRFAASRDGGAHWDAPHTIQSDTTNGGSTDDHALHVAADGAIYVTWLALTRDTSHTYLARSTDGGATWSAPARIDEGPSCPCCRTALTSGPDGSLYAAWRKIYPGGAGQPEIRDIVVARSTDQGRSWGAPVRVHEDDWHVTYCPDAGPSVKVGADNTVHVAWWTGKPGGAGVRYAQSRDGGASFSAPIPLGVAAMSRAAHVQLALAGRGDSTRVIATWEDATRQEPPIVVRVSRDGGRTFDAATVLSTAGARVGYPVVALRGDTVRVAWQQRTRAGAARDSAAQDSIAHALQAARQAAPAAQYINPVGAWQVIARTGVLGP